VTDPEAGSAPRPELTFFFPAFNEEENVESTVARALSEIGPLVESLEVLIVDDGSTDRTPELADALAAADPRVRVVHQPNRGYGGAIKTGFEHAAGGLIGFSDGDLQFDLAEMSILLERLRATNRPVDAVIGYRRRRQEGVR
jgi:glycosyltransferase involved in cell wall biosynthesis